MLTLENMDARHEKKVITGTYLCKEITIQQLKEQIIEQKIFPSSIKASEIQLFFNDKELIGYDTTLHEYGIRKEAVLQIKLKEKLQKKVTNGSGKKKNLTLRKNSMSTNKKKLEDAFLAYEHKKSEEKKRLIYYFLASFVGITTFTFCY